MLHNKKGAALLQVLLVTSILAGLVTMILRANLARTLSARQTNRTTSAQMLINACQAEVNALWTAKTPESFASDMAQCCMYRASGGACQRSYECEFPGGAAGITYKVTAAFSATPDANRGCELTYTVKEKNNESANEVTLY